MFHKSLYRVACIAKLVFEWGGQVLRQNKLKFIGTGALLDVSKTRVVHQVHVWIEPFLSSIKMFHFRGHFFIFFAVRICRTILGFEKNFFAPLISCWMKAQYWRIMLFMFTNEPKFPRLIKFGRRLWWLFDPDWTRHCRVLFHLANNSSRQRLNLF